MTKRLSCIICVAVIGGWLFGFGGCTTAEVSPISGAVPPNYIRAAHPAGYAISDLEAIFNQREAPTMESLASCDADFFKLKKLTLSVEEYKTGIRQLVRQDPLTYHWCFYGKLLTLHNQLKEMNYVDEKQKYVLKTFEYLVPVARVFQAEFSDTRYLRWAVARYRQISEGVFFRKLDLTPRTTSDLVEAYNPFGLWREPQGPRDVLDKYNLGTNATPPLQLGAKKAEESAPVAAAPAAPTAPVASNPTPAPVETFSAAPKAAEPVTAAAAPTPVQTVTPLASDGLMEAPPLPPRAAEQASAKPAPVETFAAKTPDPAPAAQAAPARAPAQAKAPTPAAEKPGPTEAVLQDDTVIPTN